MTDHYDLRQRILDYLDHRPPQTLDEIKAALHLDDVQTMEVARMLRDRVLRYAKTRRDVFRYEVVK